MGLESTSETEGQSHEEMELEEEISPEVSSLGSFMDEYNTLSGLPSSEYNPLVDKYTESYEGSNGFFDFLKSIGKGLGSFFKSIADIFSKNFILVLAVLAGVVSIPLLVSLGKSSKVKKEFVNDSSE